MTTAGYPTMIGAASTYNVLSDQKVVDMAFVKEGHLKSLLINGENLRRQPSASLNTAATTERRDPMFLGMRQSGLQLNEVAEIGRNDQSHFVIEMINKYRTKFIYWNQMRLNR